jgi:hypothetical protein
MQLGLEFDGSTIPNNYVVHKLHSLSQKVVDSNTSLSLQGRSAAELPLLKRTFPN